MNFLNERPPIGVIGSGAMGSGIAQVAAMAGHPVKILDSNKEALEKSRSLLNTTLQKLEEKGKIANASAILAQFEFVTDLKSFSSCKLVIEAIVEHLEIKKQVFRDIENIVDENCILASNTSSLSITSIAAACNKPERVIGIHFFNPAPLMALVEVIPAVQTGKELPASIYELLKQWGKVPVMAKDTPGFIVNRVARPFYGEALRIMEEGIADMETIDQAMTALGNFRMGPFTLMDYIGHDVNYVVTETVFQAFFYDPRYKPSFSQKRLLEAGWLGRKSGRGFYNYAAETAAKTPLQDTSLQKQIMERIVFMLINEAVDALYWNIASKEDVDLAMTKGVNYPKGLLKWCDELGADYVLAGLESLYDHYKEDRYRPSPLLRKYGIEKRRFF